jgi:phage/plasmid primase-like uncharacterized protein
MMEFVNFCRAHGLIVDHITHGRWVRTKTINHPHKRNGAYKYLGDIGFVQEHSTMTEVAVWKPEKPFTPATKARNDATLQDIRRQEARKQVAAIKTMREHWQGLNHLWGRHPYLEGKGLSMMGCSALRTDGDLLTIPVLRDGYLISLQTISPEGNKKYRYGCPIKGGSHLLQRSGAVLTCVAEGFATGLAIYQSLPQASVVVCFDAGNMVAVASQIKLKGLCVVCADNDAETAKSTGVNTGIERGIKAADEIGCGIAYPEGIKGTDWADALIEWGESGPGRLRTEIMRQARLVRRNSSLSVG